jgi:hypothetical protein
VHVGNVGKTRLKDKQEHKFNTGFQLTFYEKISSFLGTFFEKNNGICRDKLGPINYKLGIFFDILCR